MIVLVLFPGGSVAQGKEATVRVEYAGYYFGTINGDVLQEVEGEGTVDFQTSGDVIYVIMNKLGEDNQEMKVSILVDGEERVSKSTSEPMGEVRLSYSLGAEENLNGEEEDDDGGGLCGSILSAGILVLLFGLFTMAWIRKRREW